MMRCLVVVLVVLALAGCGGAASRCYDEARTDGDPTPGQIWVLFNDSGELELEVQGGYAAVADLYGAAWQADGWQEIRREQGGTTIALHLQRGQEWRLLQFVPFENPSGAESTLAMISPR